MGYPIKAVLFDLDDTLYNHHYSLQIGLTTLQRAYSSLQNWPLEELISTYVELIESLHSQVLQGLLTQEQARVQRMQGFFANYGHRLSKDEAYMVANLYREAYQSARRPVPGAIALLKALRPVVQIGIITNNTSHEQREKLDSCGFTPWLDVVVISEEVGVVKPDPAIFEIALNALGCAPAQTVMVGNSWATDILGAKQAGVSAVWLNRFDSYCPDETLAQTIHALEPTESIIDILLN